MKVEIWNPHSAWLPVYRGLDSPPVRRPSVARTRPVFTARNTILAEVLVTLRSSQ